MSLQNPQATCKVLVCAREKANQSACRYSICGRVGAEELAKLGLAVLHVVVYTWLARVVDHRQEILHNARRGGCSSSSSSSCWFIQRYLCVGWCRGVLKFHLNMISLRTNYRTW